MGVVLVGVVGASEDLEWGMVCLGCGRWGGVE